MVLKEYILYNSYNDLYNALNELCRYDMVGIIVDESTLKLIKQLMVVTIRAYNHTDDYNWDDVIKIKETNNKALSEVNELIVSKYGKLFFE